VLTHIARPYATALFELAAAEGSLNSVEQGLADISGLVAESPDFARLLRSPVINGGDKARAVDTILGRAGAPPMVANLVKVVARNGRLFALPEIIRAFGARAAAARGEATADVTSATPLTEAQRIALAEALRARIGKQVALNTSVDPSLIGGLVVKIGSQMIDSSLKTKLTAMKIAMKEVS
jgi:F-type H+-transporting ATPase subunit delta